MIDTKHEYAVEIMDWFVKNDREVNCSDEIVLQIYKDISYFGNIVDSQSLTERVRVLKMQMSYIRKNILGLMYVNNNNSSKGIREGYVYAIHNPAWENYVKVGSTIDIYDRLASYQTSSPLRDYELIGYIYTKDRTKLEKEIHAKFERNNEWVKTSKDTIKKFLYDHEEFPEDAIKRWCLQELVNTLGTCGQIQKIKFDKERFKWFLSRVKHTLSHIDPSYKGVDVSSAKCVTRKNGIWFHRELGISAEIFDGKVFVRWEDVLKGESKL